MRFECVCECARMMSHARSMQRKRCLCRQLGMAGTVSMGTRRARLHSTGTHGMDCACRCDRAARLVRPVRDVDSCTADELHVGLQCCCNRILVQRRRRETPVRCFSTPPLTKRLHSRRCGRVRCQTAHSIQKVPSRFVPACRCFSHFAGAAWPPKLDVAICRRALL